MDLEFDQSVMIVGQRIQNEVAEIASRIIGIPGRRIAYTHGIISLYALLESFYDSSATTFFSILSDNRSEEIFGFPILRDKVLTNSLAVLARFEMSSASRAYSREDVVSNLSRVYANDPRGLLPKVITESQSNVRISRFEETYDGISSKTLMSRLADDSKSREVAVKLGFSDSADGVKNAIEDLVERRNRLAHDLPEDSSILSPADVCLHIDLINSVSITIASFLRGIIANNLILYSSCLNKVENIEVFKNGVVIVGDTPCVFGLNHMIISGRIDASQSEVGWDIYPIAGIEFNGRALKRISPKNHSQFGVELGRGKISKKSLVYIHKIL